MANIKYFADLDGEAHQLTAIQHDGSPYSSAKHFTGRTADGLRVQATRAIEYKQFARKHDCDARCLNATGRTMKCECACGGKNHGRGAVSLVCVAVPVA